MLAPLSLVPLPLLEEIWIIPAPLGLISTSLIGRTLVTALALVTISLITAGGGVLRFGSIRFRPRGNGCCVSAASVSGLAETDGTGGEEGDAAGGSRPGATDSRGSTFAIIGAGSGGGTEAGSGLGAGVTTVAVFVR
jgi:hypothetical protein